MMQEQVIIVGAGPAGLALAASLSLNSIPYILLERDDCCVPLWRKKSYDRLHLHLAKQFCELPHMPYPPKTPTYVPRDEFLQYVDRYVAHFGISPKYMRSVELAEFDEERKLWRVKARKVGEEGVVEEYGGKYLVVACGHTTDAFVPEIEGIEDFHGAVIHSTQYKNGKEFENKNVLVVGCGNSGMEIALDLSNFNANASIVIRSPTHVFSRGITYVGMLLFPYIPFKLADSLMVMLSKLWFGDLSKYGIRRPEESPTTMVIKYGKYPVIDVGTIDKIKSGKIQVLPAIQRVRKGLVEFENGKSQPFDALILATGFKRSTSKWLKGDDYLLNEDGLPKPPPPDHWKGKNGLYCIGLSRRGFIGFSADAKNIVDDIKSMKPSDSIAIS